MTNLRADFVRAAIEVLEKLLLSPYEALLLIAKKSVDMPGRPVVELGENPGGPFYVGIVLGEVGLIRKKITIEIRIAGSIVQNTSPIDLYVERYRNGKMVVWGLNNLHGADRM